MSPNRFLVPLILTLTLSACSSDEGEDTSGGALTGFLFPGGLSGLPYETPSRSGLTGANGEFLYLPGETITFRIGDLVFAEQIVAKQYMTTLDFESDLTAAIDVGEVDKQLSLHENLEATAATEYRVSNKLSMLLSLDDNREREDGIQISLDTRSAIESDPLASSVDFDIPPGDFIADESDASALIGNICFPENDPCNDDDSRGLGNYGDLIGDYLEDRYFDIAGRIFPRPETVQIAAGDAQPLTVTIQILGLHGRLLQMEVATADQLAQLTENPPPNEKTVIVVDGFSVENGTVTFHAEGSSGDETELVINLKLDNDYRWMKKVVRVKIT